jgi:hypothetical protein
VNVANKILKSITFGLVAVCAAFLVGCMGNDVQGSQEKYGSVSVSIGTGDVNSASKPGLAKSATISLSKLVITFISNATPADTIRDTIRAGVSQGFTSVSTSNQTVDSSYVLKALRTWYVTAKTLDSQDSVVHVKVDTIAKLLAGENRSKSLTLNPRFVMYKANFSFPDSLSSTTGPNKQKINVTRLIMKVNGTTVVDSSATFNPATAYTIGYDYVPVNLGTTVQLLVIGNLVGSNIVGDSVLFRNTNISINSLAPGVDGSQSAVLSYVGPTTGTGALTVTIVKVGVYTVTATTDSAGVPKKVFK